MSRKNSRRQRRALERAGRKLAAHKNDKPEDAGTAHTTMSEPSTNSKWRGARDWVGRSSVTDWCIAVFTLALVLTSLYQFIVMSSQLDAMRKDQRPWIKVTFDNFTTSLQAPLGGNLHMVNNGKTPAKNIDGKIIFERVENGEQPRLDGGTAWVKFTTGVQFPNDPQTQPVSMQHTVNRPGGIFYESVMPTQSELDDYNAGKIFYVAYAEVKYKDYFGREHWTKFCTFMATPNLPQGVTAKRCTDYNDIDDN
jgi:hypothetical protein